MKYFERGANTTHPARPGYFFLLDYLSRLTTDPSRVSFTHASALP